MLVTFCTSGSAALHVIIPSIAILFVGLNLGRGI